MRTRRSRCPGLPSTLVLLALLSASCSKVSAPGGPPNPSSAPTADDVRTFLTGANDSLLKLGIAASQAGWVAQNFITDDTEALDSRATQALADAAAKYAKEAVRFDKVDVPADLRRQLDLLKVSLVLATPSDPKASEELTRIVSKMRGTYGKGRWCLDPAKPDVCHNIDDVTRVMATSRNEPELRREWEGWHTDLAADEDGLCAVRRAVQCRCQGARVCGYGGDVAGEVRHAARRVRDRARPAVGAGPAALSRAPRATCG